MIRAKTIHTIESLRARCVEEGECWHWQGYSANHVPQVHDGEKMTATRKVMWRLMGHEVKKGYYSTSCGHKDCVNPEHLVYRSPAVHMRKMNAQEFTLERKLKMQQARRARPDIVLSESLAREIRVADGRYSDIGAQYGVTKAVVSRIKQGRLWRDTANPFGGLMR